ncbi:DUF551 domain-containing protein [Phytopseudomonas daroniae]|uniref:DUF551 domain-containing protein n=1 Tax=Phytopseudomonas daroniae TaxID=2487519 RepID=UPI0013F16686|nr:DUF551 domain-containing protein [Pseudomonas daroniae]
MQVNQPQGGAAEPTTPRYDTIVIRGATGKNVPREVDGGEVVSWAVGHKLAALDALEEFVDDMASGNCNIPSPLTAQASSALDLMHRREALGWDADEPSEAAPLDWKSAVARAKATARKVFGETNDDAMQAIEYLTALLLVDAPADPTQQWIPVTHRLPECRHECTTDHLMVSDSVLVTDDSSLQNLGMAHLKDTGEWTVYEGEHDFMNPENITHWMPMPSSPRKQAQGGAQ